MLAADSNNGMNGQVNYDNYAHAVAMPGPVISSKNGKQYTPQLSDLGKKRPPMGAQLKIQASSGLASNGLGLEMHVPAQA